MVFAKIKVWLAGAAAFIAALGSVCIYLIGRKDGKAALRAQKLEADLEDVKKANEVDHEIVSLDRAAVDDRLGKWMRD